MNTLIYHLQRYDKKGILLKNIDKEYILKEAEMIVNYYISKIENKDNSKIIINKDTDEKYKKLKKYGSGGYEKYNFKGFAFCRLTYMGKAFSFLPGL